MIGSFLYSLQPQEAVSAPVLQRFITRRQTSSLAVQIADVLLTVPLEKAFLLTDLTMNSIGGAGQNATLNRWRIQDAQVNVMWEYREAPNSRHGGGAGLEFSTTFHHIGIVLMPDERIEFVSDFSAAVNANIQQASIAGMFLPRGTLQLR